jgi:predicted RND superfamily exporter protein
LGIFGIPLDLMSITIISIALGISVDDSIHFVDRYNLIKIDKGLNTQKTVGVAMLLTTIAVIIGFSVMVFSNFIPSIYFGVLISIVMVIALLINQTLLPYLLNKTEKN